MVQVRIRLAIDARAARLALAALLLCAASSELESQTTESISVTTYYPAPKGYYATLKTTGQTYMATQSGGVTIGSTAAGTAKLAVMNGNMGIGTYDPNAALDLEGNQTFGADIAVDRTWGVDWNNGSMGGSGFWYGINREPGAWAFPYPKLKVDWFTGVKIKAHSGYGGVSIWEDWCDSGMDNCNTAGSGYGSEIAHFRISVYNGSYINSRLVVGSNQNAVGTLDVAGDGVGAFRQTGCRAVGYGIGGTTSCFGGEYATNQSGVFSKYGGSGSGGNGTMYCCPCPGAGCASIP